MATASKSKKASSTPAKVAKEQAKEAEELKKLQADVHEENVTNVPGSYTGEVRTDPDSKGKTQLLASVQSVGSEVVLTVPKSPLRLSGEQAQAFLRHFSKSAGSL